MATPPSPPPSSASNGRIPRSVLIIAGAVVGLILVALILALAIPVKPTTYASGTPEAAFQDFYAAWAGRDLDTAYGLLSEDVRSGLSLTEYRRQDSDMSWARDQHRRVVLLASHVTGDRAVLDLRVDQFSEGPLGGDRYSLQALAPAPGHAPAAGPAPATVGAATPTAPTVPATVVPPPRVSLDLVLRAEDGTDLAAVADTLRRHLPPGVVLEGR